MQKKYLLIIPWLLILDTFTKFWAENSVVQENIMIIPWLLSFEYAQNIGIAFSIPITWWFLKVLTLILIFGIFWYYFTEERSKKNSLLDMSYALIFAGALWNGWERIFRWYVTDFISLEYFAIFNLADSYITLWALWIIWYYFQNKELSSN